MRSPAASDEEVWVFYTELAELARKHAGMEALRLAIEEDDKYARLSKSGVPPAITESRARTFFYTLLGSDDISPDWCGQEDWDQLKMIRAQWVRPTRPA